ncbi:MAG: carbamoyltransferase HypF [Candidatus Heimdallarchaeota archaeon]
MNSRVKIICSGIVQGIGFRPFVYRIAKKSKVNGFVRNQGDAGVLIIAEGTRKKLEEFIYLLEHNKPYLAKYEELDINWEKYKNDFSQFQILKSSENKLSGVSYLPPDISVCEDCLLDMKNIGDSRYQYAFASCAICGPRYTTITELPYDRPNTTMIDFPLCESCTKEYTNPIDRRYHAQTTCCNVCGPQLSLHDKDGNIVDSSDLFKDVAKLLSEGNILAIKGIGGTHLACSTILDEPILRLRTRKGKRKYKPFAVISRNVATVKSFARVNKIEEDVITSHRRPIVLLEKNEPFLLSEWISPKLHNVGVMLPYSGIHSLILDNVDESALVLTSANPSNVPMYIENEQILTKAKSLADYFILHNRRIHQRSDDSVIRLTNDNPVLIRRSRGWVPEPINLPFDLKDLSSLGVGPLLTSTAALAKKNRCFPSQYIGNIDTLETLDFLESSINHLKKLLDVKTYDTIGCDMHPTFLSTTLAEKLSEANDASLSRAQHHHAHAIALMVDNSLPIDDEIVTIVADGVGYGDDGKIWGGEILHSSYSKYIRVGHLEEQKMIGGDRATYYPIRMAAGILSKIYDKDTLFAFLENYQEAIPDGINEIHVILKQLEKSINLYETTSTGRILAASSAILKACFERTYEGEPAIVLESLAKKGRADKVKLEISSNDSGIIQTTALIDSVYNNLKQGFQPSDIAVSIHNSLADQFADVAINYAQENNIRKIGFTGGVAYNDLITRRLSKSIKNAGFEFLVHRSLPCGDGSISTGQAIKAVIDYL